MTKVCSKCKIEKEICQFPKAKTGKFGVRGECKACRKDYSQKYHIINKKRVNIRNKEWNRNNKEKIKKYTKEYYKNNKDKSKDYYETNKEKILEWQKEYYKNNKDKRKDYYETNKEKINAKVVEIRRQEFEEELKKIA